MLNDMAKAIVEDSSSENTYTNDTELDITMVDKGYYAEGDKRTKIKFEIEVEKRSWGIKDINVHVNDPITFLCNIFDMDKEEPIKEDVEITVNPDDIKTIFYDEKGDGVYPAELRVKIDKDGKLISANLSCCRFNQ